MAGKATWDKEVIKYEYKVDNLHRRLVESVKAGQAMYVAVCKPGTGVAAGLGLMLAACPGSASGAVVSELIEGGTAAGADKSMSVGDLILEVDGVHTACLSVEEVENLMCGPMGEAVTIRAQQVGGGASYEVVLARGCGHAESAVADLVGHMQADACTTAARLRKELEELRQVHATATAKHAEQSQLWREEKDKLNSEMSLANQREQKAVQHFG